MSIYVKGHIRSIAAINSKYSFVCWGKEDFKIDGKKIPMWIVNNLKKYGNCYINNNYNLDLLGYFGIKYTLVPSISAGGFVINVKSINDEIYKHNIEIINSTKKGCEYDGLIYLGNDEKEEYKMFGRFIKVLALKDYNGHAKGSEYIIDTRETSVAEFEKLTNLEIVQIIRFF